MTDIYDEAIEVAIRIHDIGGEHIGIYVLVNELIAGGIEPRTALAKKGDIIAYEKMIARWMRLPRREKEQYDTLRALEQA